VQVGLIVVGHVVAVVIAHENSLPIWDSEKR
jgi:hypothetical protein